MPKIFAELGIKANTVLEKKDFVLYHDVENRELVPEKMEKVVARAEQLLAEPIPFLPLSVFLEFRDNGNRSNYQGLYFKRREMVFTMALAEAYEKKGRFTARIADLVWAIMEESTWMIPAHMYNSPTHAEYALPPVYDNTRIHGIDLFSASTAAILTNVYRLVGEALNSISPIICEKLLFMLNDRIIKPYLNCSFWWTGERGNGVNNWCPWVTSNILITMSVITEDIYTRKAVVTKALASLDAFTADYKSDGGCTEGPSYWGAAGASYFDCLELLSDITGGAINVYSHPLVKNMFEYIVKFNINGTRFINFADCGPSCHHDGAMIRRMGQRCESETLCSFGDTMAMISDGGVGYGGHSHSYRCIRNLMTKTPTECVKKASKRVWLPDLKVMTARADEDPEKGLFLAIKGGSNGEQHNHNDVGNFVVYYEGRPVIIDTGVGEYTKKTFSPQRYELWFMQSNYHNLPAFGGVAQNPGGRYASSDEVYDPESGAVSMELKGAYPPSAGIVSYRRSAVLENDGEIVITDSFELNEAKDVDFRIMTHVCPEIAEQGVIKLCEGRVMTYDPALECEIEEFEVNDRGIQSSWKRSTLFRIHFKTNADKGKLVFKIK